MLGQQDVLQQCRAGLPLDVGLCRFAGTRRYRKGSPTVGWFS
jgi:hypothetical protein